MSPIASQVDGLVRRANNLKVAAWMRALAVAKGAAPARVDVSQDGDNWPSDVRIERVHEGFSITFPRGARQRFILSFSQTFLRAYFFWLLMSPPEVRYVSFTASDGDMPSQARFSPSSRLPSQIPIPDPHFFQRRGFARERSLLSTGLPWDQRSSDIVWRGAMSGSGDLAFDAAAASDPKTNARLRLALLFRGVPDTNVHLTDFGWRDGYPQWVEVGRDLGLVAARIPEETWLTKKFAIDIDGFSNSWSNFFVRMLFGCCVFKVDSQLGFRQWYYDRIKPFEHYVPVRADMSDFMEKIDWARSHDSEARSIAENGQRFAMTLDFEAGKRDAIDIISANWNRP